jgi:RND superfamily putative drug exporter
MMLFAVLFGLSMDYEVFLLSRVREEYLRTGKARAAVADGIAATARVITAAASVMVVVFSSFLLNDDRVVNLFGFGLAVAIAIDATIVRLVLVPALMSVAGRAAWYMPRWMDRLLPKIELEAHPTDPLKDELDELEPAEEAPRHVATPHTNGVGPRTGQIAGTPARTISVVDESQGEPGSPDPGDPVYAALEVLGAAVRQRDDYRIRYERALVDLTELRHRHDALLAALRTLRSADVDEQNSPDDAALPNGGELRRNGSGNGRPGARRRSSER